MDEERKYITRTNSVNWPTSVQHPVVLIVGRRRAPELSKKRDASDWWNEELAESLSTRYSLRTQTQNAGPKTSLPLTACPPSPTSLNHPRIVTAPQLTPCRFLPPGIASRHSLFRSNRYPNNTTRFDGLFRSIHPAVSPLFCAGLFKQVWKLLAVRYRTTLHSRGCHSQTIDGLL